MAAEMDRVIGETAVELDARFESIRTQETNIGNFIADTIRTYSVIQSMTHPLRFLFNSRTLIGCTDPLRRGVGAPHQCPLGVGSKLPLLRDADVHTF